MKSTGKRYLLLILLIALIGCDKDNDPSQSYIHIGLGKDTKQGDYHGKPLNVLAMGQSNMVYWTPPGQETFVYQMTPQYAANVVNCAVGGTYIREWAPGTPNFETCMNELDHVDAVLFYQGEADTQSNGDYTTWARQFEEIVEELRRRKGKDIPVIFCQLADDPDVFGSSPTNPGGNRWLHWADVKAQQASVRLSDVDMIVTAGLATTDDHVHLTPDSYRALGVKFACVLKNELAR